MSKNGNYLLTSESVSCGHPDKLADQISDTILDEFLKKDSESKVACETFITDGLVIVGGEVHSNAYVDLKECAKKVIKEAGYTSDSGFDPENFGFLSCLHEQSPDIRQCVEKEDKKDQGAGDQGIMFGYASDETNNYMPVPILLANKTMEIYDKLRKNGELKGCRPDAKCQYTIEYKNDKPHRIKIFLISMQHDENVSMGELNAIAFKLLDLVEKTFPELNDLFNEVKILVNPSGKFIIGGAKGDTGLTGRKIIVDSYGGICPHGGGACSGKDSSKVDRSGAYMARYIAKNYVAAGIAKKMCIQLSYAIGVAQPVSIFVNTYGTGIIKDEEISKSIYELFDMTPYGIIKQFNLKNPIFLKTSTYGHFGREFKENCFAWENLDRVNDIRQYFENIEK